MSEVIGYILGFFMSFLLLMMAITAFDIRVDAANDEATRVHYEDLANRVAAAVLGAVNVGTQRAGSEGVAPSQELVYYERVRIPTQIRGQDYRVTLTNSEITISGARSGYTQEASLFNLQLPATDGDCTEADAVCSLGGSVTSSSGFILVKYEFKRGTAASSPCATWSPRNCITLG